MLDFAWAVAIQLGPLPVCWYRIGYTLAGGRLLVMVRLARRTAGRHISVG
jgi:hypothetical protein